LLGLVNLKEALGVIKAKQSEGLMPVITVEDINCLRGFQNIIPLREFIIIDSPIIPIGFFKPDDFRRVTNHSVNGYDALVLDSEGGGCNIGVTGNFEALLHFITAEKPKHEARVTVASADDALTHIGSMSNTLVILSDSLPCIWALQDLTPIEAVIIEEPLTLITLIGKEDAPIEVRRRLSDDDWEHAVFVIVTGSGNCQADTFYSNPPRVNIAVLFLRDFLASGTSVVKYRDAILTLMPSK
jgi:hypothetical protein